MVINLVDDWREGDKISLVITSRSDSSPVKFDPLMEVNNQRSTWASDNCGSTFTDFTSSIFIHANHSEPDLKIDLYYEMASDTTAYLMLGNINLLFSLQPIDYNRVWVRPDTGITSYSASPSTSNAFFTTSCDTLCRFGYCFIPSSSKGCFVCNGINSNNGSDCVMCTSVSRSNVCLQCPIGHHPDSGVCVPDRASLCDNWIVDTCTFCKDGYYLNHNGCSKCASSCKTCSIIQSNCTSCWAGYHLAGNNCNINSKEDIQEGLQTISDMLALGNQITSIVTTVINLVNFANPAAMMMSLLAKMFQYLRYLRIDYPTKLQYLLDQSLPPLILLEGVTSIPEVIGNKIPRYTLPDNFEKYSEDIHSSFLVNFWSSIIGILFICTIITLACILECSTRQITSINSRLTKVKYALKWNYFLATFFGYYGDIAFYTSMEFRIIWFHSFLEALSFSVSLIVNIVMIYILLRTLIILNRLMRRNKTQRSKSSKELFKGYQILFENFKDSSFLQQGFLVFFIFKIYFYSMIVAYLFDHPLAQTLLMNIMSFSTVLCLLIKRPFKENLDLIAMIGQEVVLQVQNICVFVLAFDDAMTINYYRPNRNLLGDIIIGCNGAVMGICLIYQAVQILIMLKNTLKYVIDKFRKKSNQDNVIIEKDTTSMTPSINLSDDSSFTNNHRTLNETTDNSLIKNKSKNKNQIYKFQKAAILPRIMLKSRLPRSVNKLKKVNQNSFSSQVTSDYSHGPHRSVS